jgi:hypothetical protein
MRDGFPRLHKKNSNSNCGSGSQLKNPQQCFGTLA